jgi:hypothetical protein
MKRTRGKAEKDIKKIKMLTNHKSELKDELDEIN